MTTATPQTGAPAPRKQDAPPRATQGDITNYAVGEGANSLSNNSMGNFGLLYLTVIIGLEPVLAGIILSVSLFWDALTDPLMGHISDNTRSRWGRRHPFLLLGGLSVAAVFLCYFTLPQFMDGSAWFIFGFFIVLNLAFKTAQTVYFVPYTAFGFEVCPQYDQRATLQGRRWFVNQTLNFLFGAAAWPLFFQDQINENTGEVLNGSRIASNYINMGVTISIAIAAVVIYCALTTRRYAKDNRSEPKGDFSLMGFWKDFFSIFRDKLALFVIAFVVVAGFAMAFMAKTQMYTYVYFMEFSPWEKMFAHGGGMIAMALSAGMLLPLLVRLIDKKPAGFVGMGLSIAGGVGLWLVFSTGLMPPQYMPLDLASELPFGMGEQPFHLSAIVFGVLQMLWWGGCGIVVPLSLSMMADVAGLNAKKTGTKPKNAGYASVYSFCQKLSWSITGLVIASAIQAAGWVSGENADQTPEAVRNIADLTFLSGPAIMVFAAIMLAFYPVNRKMMAEYGEE
ncbi:MAG: MFS transporter [Phycisphaeraceae bacterium]